MLFNLFGKQEEPADAIFADRVYIGSEAKMDACVRLAKERPDVLFIAWFSDTARIYKKNLYKMGFRNQP